MYSISRKKRISNLVSTSTSFINGFNNNFINAEIENQNLKLLKGILYLLFLNIKELINYQIYQLKLV